MTELAPSGDPSCPVPEPSYELLRHVRGHTLEAGTRLHRGHHVLHAPALLVPGIGNTRFAPVDDTDHAYAATNPVAAALESLLHQAWGPDPRIHEALLGRWALSEVEVTSPLRLADLRDVELQRLGVTRGGLVATAAEHYPCTRRWAAELAGRNIGGHRIAGAIWQSRQHELRAAAHAARPALASLLGSGATDVVVIWAPPAPADVLAATGTGIGPLDGAAGEAFVADLADLLDITIL